MSKHFEKLKTGIENFLKEEQNIEVFSLIFHIPLMMLNPKKINEKLIQIGAKNAYDLCFVNGEFSFENSKAWVNISGIQMNNNKVYCYNLDVQQKKFGRRIWLNYYYGKFTFFNLQATPTDFVKAIEHFKSLMSFV